MKRLLSVCAAMAAFVLAVPAAASAGLTANHPFRFAHAADPDICGPGVDGHRDNIVAKWKKGVGVAGTGDKLGLILEKNEPTNSCSSAGVNIKGFDNGVTLSQLAFDVHSKGTDHDYCGAGAPRYTVVLTDNSVFFFGCDSGKKSDIPGNPSWQRVTFEDEDAAPQQSEDWPGFGKANVRQIQVLQDESGQTLLDNFRVNNQTVGKGTN